MIKNFGVRFYCGAFLDTAETRKISEILQSIHAGITAGGATPHLIDGTVSYEIRDLISINNGAVFRGVLAVLRDDAPNIRDASGAERPIVLAQNEHIIEKNHFLYYCDRQLLVWQVNGRGSHVSRMEKYISFVAGAGATLADVIQPAALERLKAGAVKRFKLRVAAPKNAAAIDANNWEDSTIALMNGLGGSTMTIEVSTRKKGQGLVDEVKQITHRLLDREETRSLQVVMVGDQEPIDLFADCLTAKINVNMVGAYPDPTDVFAALAQAKDNQQDALNEYFGQGDLVLE